MESIPGWFAFLKIKARNESHLNGKAWYCAVLYRGMLHVLTTLKFHF